MHRWYRLQIIKKLSFPFMLLMALLVCGITGYVVIEGFTFLEALYMTVITMASIGYGEVRPLSDSGRIFTMALIVVNVGLLTYFITVLTRYIADGDFRRQYKLYKMYSSIQHLKDHVIICGYGRNGREAAHVLNENRIPFLVIEEKDVEPQKQYDHMHILKGNATEDETLNLAGLQKAKAVITTLPNDADNLYVVLTAKQYSDKITIISRASQDSSVAKLKVAGASNVIMPDKLGGAHMASLVMNPDVMELLSLLSARNSEEFRVQELHVRDKKVLGEIEIWKKTGCTVLGIKGDTDYLLNPSSEQVLIPGERLIVMGSDEQIGKARELL